MNDCIIFTGNSVPTVSAIKSYDPFNYGILMGDIYHHQFASGEFYCQLKTNVRGSDVFLVQSLTHPVNDNLMQLLVMADATRRASADRITAVIPYLGYGRQDRKDKPRVPISAKLVMDMFEAAGIDRIIVMDLHAPQIAGMTNLPCDHLYFSPVLIPFVKPKNIDVIVAPDMGAVKKAEEYASRMNVDLAFISKKRTSDTTVETVNFVGDIKDKNVLIVDDIIESAGTITNAAKICRDNGASNVYCGITHNCLSPIGVERMTESLNTRLITEFFTSNSNGKVKSQLIHDKAITIDICPLFFEAISRIHTNQSVTSLFK